MAPKSIPLSHATPSSALPVRVLSKFHVSSCAFGEQRFFDSVKENKETNKQKQPPQTKQEANVTIFCLLLGGNTGSLSCGQPSPGPSPRRGAASFPGTTCTKPPPPLKGAPGPRRRDTTPNRNNSSSKGGGRKPKKKIKKIPALQQNSFQQKKKKKKKKASAFLTILTVI